MNAVLTLGQAISSQPVGPGLGDLESGTKILILSENFSL